ncbi:methylated-DNA--[protein]-cysteine S-methyltransferase [Novacetimonas cocois]|uniref:methylated-DNA--[protein]-cysteine S-methyltransferase n=1 Tax=Novacetimonas cocois TaxID=1747507 RepID=A0A365YUD5_9PROT|nr:methylated-DNA--[protein]-cysteine S-methyltransferase [Novacetimonas cocois]RBM06152.1 LysR family transcriptional regulator [Novacetimonas cocois]
MTDTRLRGVSAGSERLGMAMVPCSLGMLGLISGERGVVAIMMGDDADTLSHDLRARFAGAELTDDDPQARLYLERVGAYVDAMGDGDAPDQVPDLPLDMRGTPFQQRVWDVLRTIPPGGTLTYADIARRLDAPRAVRAVGRACGANALAIVIPCHRVIRTDGTLSGYRWGVARKQALLDREAASVKECGMIRGQG